MLQFRFFTFIAKRLDRLAYHLNSSRLQRTACSLQLWAYELQYPDQEVSQ